MEEITGTAWQRQGCSLVWEKEMLLPLLQQARPRALREALLWLDSGFPTLLPRQPVLVAGLQTCLELLPTPQDGRQFLRATIQPLIRRWQDEFPQCGLVFGLNCDAQQWSFDANDCGILTLRRNHRVEVVAGLWNGAARDANKLMISRPPNIGTSKPGKTDPIFGGIYVRRLS